MKLRSAILACTLIGAGFAAAPDAAADEPFVGELRLYGNNFCPRGWAPANGAMLPISQNSALFSLLGTIYGGDGRTTFALPNLNDRAPVGDGNGPGLTPYRIGQTGGSSQTTLTSQNVPAHTHDLRASNDAVDTHDGEGDYFGNFGGFTAYGDSTSGGTMNDNAVSSVGGGNVPINLEQPTLTMNWCIALTGIYPSRS